MNNSEQIDLNIDNYNLHDLLNLFKLDFDFNEDDMKQAKRVVLKTHPDIQNGQKIFSFFYQSL